MLPSLWTATGGSRGITTLRQLKGTTWASSRWREYASFPPQIYQLVLTWRQILEVCYKTGVKVVTIYAFSIENFKRSKHEVDALMDMAKVKLEQLSEHGALLDRYGASVRILGRRHMVNDDVLAAIDRAVALTAHNKK